MTNRESDARAEVDEFEGQIEPVTLPAPDTTLAPAHYYRPPQGNLSAPDLTVEEMVGASNTLREMLDTGMVKYPELANHLLKNPSNLWLLAEIQLMLDPDTNPVSYDFTADLMEGLTTNTARRLEYEHVTAHSETQQLFWEEVGSLYPQEEREFIIGALSQLNERGANRVAALALAWKDSQGELDGQARAQLFLNLAAWAAGEQSTEQGEDNIFFQLLDAPQEIVEQTLISPLINAGVGLLGGADEAARRKHLTPGQQLAYMAGIKPPEIAGEFGWWNLVSGTSDALIEIGGDPFAWLAGLGAGLKAVKTVPNVAAKATKAGRAAAALRALLPKPFTGLPRTVRGGRFARVTYALGSKSIDDLLEAAVKNGVADDALQLIKQGNIPKFRRLYPAWGNVSDEAIRTMQEAVQTPDEFIEVLKADALNEVLNSGVPLEELSRLAFLSEEALNAAANDATAQILRNPGDFVYHATSAKNAQSIARQGFRGGTLVDDPMKAINHAKSRGKFLDDAGNLKEDTVLIAIPRNTLVGSIPSKFDDAGFATTGILPDIKPGAGGNPMKPVQTLGIDEAERLLVKGEMTPARFSEMMLNQNIPHDVRLAAAQDRLRLNAHNRVPTNPLILSEVPQRSKRVFSWQRMLEASKSRGRFATGLRRTIARSTPGRIPDEIRLFDTRNGVEDLRLIAEHFGVRQTAIDNLIDEFMGLELGARQEWVWDTFLRAIGRETGLPAFEHQLIQFYKGSGIRNFASSGADLLPGGHRIPILPTQLTQTMPIPVDILTTVFKRAKHIGNRSKLARAMGFNGRGLLTDSKVGTRTRRKELVARLRKDLGDQAENMSDEQLYDLAFSLVSPNDGLDGRGIWSGRIFPKVGSWGNQLHNWFTKSMLVFRPIQWMWRVALLEEPIRAHIFNMPSLYSNPLQYMGRMRESYYIWNVGKWAETNLSWAQDLMSTMLRGSKDDIVKRLDDAGLLDDIFTDGIPNSTRAIRQGVESYVENAIYGRVRPNKLNPIKRVPWAVKNRAHNINRAENMMKRLGPPVDFQEAAQPIAGRLVAGYLGESVGASQRMLYQWQPGMVPDEAFTHGRVWGAKLVEFVEDPYGRAAVRRWASLLRGDQPDITGATLVNSSRWQLMAPDLRRAFPDETDDLIIAERYLDEILSAEIDNLFRPFIDELDADELADLLDHFASSRRIQATIGGVDIDWDLRSANFGAGVRSVGDFTASVRQDAAVNIPSNLPAPSFDPRFMAEDDVGWPTRMADWVLQTFGEEATQTLNRRPAWIHEYARWIDNYRNIGVPDEIAQRMATDHANRMVNYVFFNMNEAPYYVARLNRILPFFGATYEVLATWSYKMPVAVGGTWPAGVGEFARKFDRLIDGLVNIGLLDREENRDGTTSLTLNLVPPDSDSASNKELGRFLQGAGFAAVNTLDQAVSTILGLEEGLGLRSQGYRLAAGHPLNPADYGILSFAQTDIGFNPVANIMATSLAALIPGAGAPRREASKQGETLADLADRLNVDVEALVRYNREVFIDTDNFGSSELYNGILTGQVDVTTLEIPALTTFNLPESSLWDAFSDTFMPFGEISSPHEFAVNFIPSGLRWAMAGIALQNQPTDDFWADNDLGGIFGGILPEVNQAQVASQLNEAFMYLEAHDLVNGQGPFTRIQEKEALLQRALSGNREAEAEIEKQLGRSFDTLDEAINAFRVEINLDTEAFLDRAQKVAAESLILRGITGNALPTTPGHVRLEEQKIRDFWDTRAYADSIKAGEGEAKLRNFNSMEDYEEYKAQLAAWLSDPTSDRARAVFRANNPQLMAYLTPKTFYTAPVPDITSYEEYQRQIESGERQPSPLHVSMWRARSASIQADYYNKFIATFGNHPIGAAATALQNRQVYNELNDERNVAYQALEMWDEMHGSVYDTWRTDNFEDVEHWAQDQINERLNKVRDNLQILFELEDYRDIELDLDGVANLNSGIRGAIAEISNAIRQYNDLTEDTNNRNAYEEAINQYFEQVYIPYAEQISALYDQLPEVGDTERQSLIYEKIKFVKNSYANTLVYLEGDTEFPFPDPLEFSWQGKDEEERQIKLQQWVTRPLMWMDLDQSRHLAEQNGALIEYLPTTLADFEVYRRYTLDKIRIDEMHEANEITTGVRRKALDRLDERLKRELVAMGRGKEVLMMDLTPYEKLELAGLLPQNLGIFSDHVRYYIQVLEAAGESAGTIIGRQITAPLYDMVEQAYFNDPHMRKTLQELGINLQDKSALDSFLPWLFFGHTGER